MFGYDKSSFVAIVSGGSVGVFGLTLCWRSDHVKLLHGIGLKKRVTHIKRVGSNGWYSGGLFRF